MRRYQGKLWGQKFVADGRKMIIHDLDNERSFCRIDEIFFANQEVPFDSLYSAVKFGYKTCPYCVAKVHNEEVASVNNRLVWKF